MASGGRRRTSVPWSIEAIRPMTERSRPFRADGLAVVLLETEEWMVAVRKGSENSMPEKGRRKRKWIRLRTDGLFVCFRRLWGVFAVPRVVGVAVVVWCSAREASLVDAFVLLSAAAKSSRTSSVNRGCVSGRQKYRYAVSVTIRSNEHPAAVANGFAATIVTVDSPAPIAGPNVNAMLKHAPTNAIVDPLWLSSLISVAMALAIWTFPSLRPPTMRLPRNVLKSVAATQSATLAMFPVIDQSSAVRRPRLSEIRPITGAARAWRKEKRDPSAPPSSTTS